MVYRILLLVIAVASLYQHKVNGTSTFPFVNVQDTTANFDATTLKTYTTTLYLDLLSNETNIDESSLQATITSFYQTQTNLSGFEQTNGFIFSRQRSNWVLSVAYNAVYNYQTLLNTPIVYETDIVDNIGTAQIIQDGLIAVDANFTSIYAGISEISFTGSSICDLVGCPVESPYIRCGEQLEGVTTYCRSLCKLNFCFRGNCFHDAADVKPMCSCPVTRDVWFVGEHCELRLALWIPWVFGAAVILVLIVILVLAIYLTRNIKIKKTPETKMIPTFHIKKTSTKSLDKAPIVENIVENTAKTPEVASSRRSTTNEYHNVWEAPSSHHTTASSKDLSEPAQQQLDQTPPEGPTLQPLQGEGKAPTSSDHSRISSSDIDLDDIVVGTDGDDDSETSSTEDNMSIDLDEIREMRLGKESKIMI